MALKRGSNDNDTLVGSSADDVLLGLAGKDRLQGGAGRDVIVGGAGDDVLDGGAGLDKLRGDTGNDTYFIDNSREIDRQLADAGIDTVRASVSYMLGVHQEHLVLQGGRNLGATGNAGANTIIGNNSANLLAGGGGADRVLGAGGTDTLVFDPADLNIDGGPGVDTLRINGRGNTLGASALSKVHHIEILDLRGTGANRLDLDKSLVTALSGGSSLRVAANGDDTVRLSGGWQHSATITIGGFDFERYFDGTSRVDIAHGAQIDNRRVLALGQLNGDDGLRIDGAGANDLLGLSIAGAGDVNGDGLADLILNGTRPGLGSHNRDAYVVFGRAEGFAPSFSVAALNGTRGFRITQSTIDNQADSHRTTIGASAGDHNGDGLGDVFVTNGNGRESAQETAYVVFGATPSVGAVIDASTQPAATAFRLHGLHKGWPYFHNLTAGDINGDGYSDLVIGDHLGGPLDGNGIAAGSTYVVFGHAGPFNADLEVSALNGGDGLRIDGLAGTGTGRRVDGAGDLNGDGIADLVLDGKYVVFGSRSSWPAHFDLSTLNGHNGFVIERGTQLTGTFVTSVAAHGDFNGDGSDDLLLSNVEPFSTPGGGGAHYVLLYGHRGNFSASVALPAPGVSQGFHLGGSRNNEYSGWTAQFAGDVDGDGYDDLIFGAPGNDSSARNAGGAYLVFGHAGAAGARVELDGLRAHQGLRLDGVKANDRSGYAVGAAGDLNGDGFDDLFVGAHNADNNGADAGSAYVVFGRDFRASTAFIGGAGNDGFSGGDADEKIIGGRGNDVLAGGRGNDVLKGGAGNDVLVFDSADTLAVEGDTGVDTLRINGANVTLDLSLARNQHLQGIERIDLSGSGANRLALDVTQVLRLPDHFDMFVTHHTSQLLVTGNANDRVTLLGSGWQHDAAPVVIDGAQYQSYSHPGAAAQLLVHSDLMQPLV